MAYVGKTYQVPCDKGGYSYNENTDLIDPTSFVSPSRNINLNRNGRSKRGGTAKVNGTAVSGSPRIMGIFDFRLSTSSFQVFAGKDGKIYRDSTTVLKTGMSTTNKFNFSVFNQELYIADGATTPQTWDGNGASTSNITTPAADWTGGNQPFQFIAHGQGSSRRMWALLGNKVYYSVGDNGKDFLNTGSGVIVIDTQDAIGLVGGVEFGNRLIVFSRNNSYIIVDDDIDRANWGWQKAQWTAGAVNWRLIVPTPNDLVVFTEEGDAYSISAVQSYGDYKQASIARPAFIDNYMRSTIDLTRIDDFHASYDPTLRAIKFFIIRAGLTTVDTALVYFIDRTPAEAWAVHDNQTSVSGYSASCSTYVRVSAGTFSIYTGDYSGFIWKLEQATRSDDSLAYYGGFKTPNLTFDNARLKKQFKRCYVVARTQGNYNLQVNVWIDGQVKTAGTISLSGAGGILDIDVLDSFVLGGVEFIDRAFELGYVGKRIQMEFYNNSAGQDFFISQVLFDFKPLTIQQ